MTWRRTWLRSRVITVVASSVIWLVVASLAPAVVVGYALLGILMVAGWRTRPLLWWRYGARKVGPVEAEPVWRALVPIEWLRGRDQPLLYSSARLGGNVVASNRRTLVLGDLVLREVSERVRTDLEFRRLVVRAFATAELNGSRSVATVEVFCLPWSILADVVGRLFGSIASVPLVGFSWRCRWLFVGLAAFDLYGRGHWPGLAMLLLTATMTVTVPRWNRDWTNRQTALADDLEHATFPSSIAIRPARSSASVGRPTLRVPTTRGS